MNKEAKVLRKSLLTMVLAVTLIGGCVCIHTPKKASAKSVSKVTKVIELTSENVKKDKEGGKEYPYTYYGTGVTHKISMKVNEKLKIKVKVLDVAGKVFSKYYTRGRKYDFGLGNYDPHIEYGSFDVFSPYTKPKLKESFFKKGNVLTSEEIQFLPKKNRVDERHAKPIVNGTKAEMNWFPPAGVTKLKLQITYYTKSGKAGIKSIKTRKG